MPTIKFTKEKKSVEVEQGSNLRKEAMKNGVEVYSGVHKYVHCPGFGLCTTCRVNITKGQENCRKPSIWEKLGLTGIFMPLTFFARIGNEDKMRLSCQTKVEGDIEVETQPGVNWHGDKFWS
ncbi:MAG: ferredoxin [Planctomycetaceae bacterium]|nr:ferredoxin [Planctomycetaceae bacterium]